jgi:two-component system NtrC family sensor kinase
MNSPLTAISYYAQAMEKLEYLKKQDREKIRRIEDSTDRIQNLLARIINYASAPPDKFVPVDLNILVRQVLDAISHELEMRPHAKIKTKLDEAMPLVRGSSTHLFDMVTNLVINALQALGTQKGQVTVSTRLAGPMVELEVKDTGAGIAAKDIERIFEPFFSRKKDGRGTGLGLAIVQRVVKLHGGEVKVKSQKGKGAVFTVLIPAALDKKT